MQIRRGSKGIRKFHGTFAIENGKTIVEGYFVRLGFPKKFGYILGFAYLLWLLSMLLITFHSKNNGQIPMTAPLMGISIFIMGGLFLIIKGNQRIGDMDQKVIIGELKRLLTAKEISDELKSVV